MNNVTFTPGDMDTVRLVNLRETLKGWDQGD
jgi:hypothetical protein